MPVSDDEEIGFLLIDPLHYDPDRKTVVPDAFQELMNRDLSVMRTAHSSAAEVAQTREDLIERGREKVPPKLRLVDEVCVGRVGDLRQAIDGIRYIAVYDTGLEDKPGHASLFVKSEVLKEKKLRKLVRAQVHGIMTKSVISYSDYHSKLK